jgi:predicted nucleotidyltransferase
MINRLRACETIPDGRSFRGAGAAREPGTHERGPPRILEKPVFMDSGPAPSGHPGMTTVGKHIPSQTLRRSGGMNPTRKWALGELRRMVLDALSDHQAEVWLFGSCARGEVFQHSDVDIAVLPRDELPSGFFSDLAERIEKSAIPYDVDVVDLRRAAPTLIDEVRREGVKWRD